MAAPSTAATSGFLPDDRRFWFLSERDGWMHLYVVDVADPASTPRQLTSGRWEIASVDLTPDETRFLLTTTEAHSGERHVYAMPFDGGTRTRLTSQTGSHARELSPDGRTVADLYSSSNRPPEVFLSREPAPAPRACSATRSPTDEWLTYKWVEPKLVTYRARDGVEVLRAALHARNGRREARIRARPAVIFVHGAGYLQNAHRYWSTYYREYMFHHLLASRGYVVLDPDYRASAGYGRDWRTAIYRHMGGKDLEDVVDGAKHLVSAERVDAEAHRRLRRQLRRLHHADGDVHDARRLRRRGRAAPGDRLGALQPRLHVEHPQRAAERRRGLSPQLADLLRRRT